jgi:hypothetical protein
MTHGERLNLVSRLAEMLRGERFTFNFDSAVALVQKETGIGYKEAKDVVSYYQVMGYSQAPDGCSGVTWS